MSNHNMSLFQALQRLNVAVAAALSAFTVLALIQYGLMGAIINFIENRPMVPGLVSLAIIAFLLITSNTRDPRFYHPAETGMIAFTIIFLLAFSLMGEIQNLVLNNWPWGGIAATAITLVGGVVVGR